MKLTFFTLLSAVILFSGCCNHRSDEQAHDDHNEETHGNELRFNNGDKWKINVEMVPFVHASERLVSQFISTEETNYPELAAQLKNNNKLLVKSCTMKGESHDQLHVWLHPYLEQVDKLEKAPTEEAAREIVEEIQSAFDTFNTYFEK